MKKVLLTYCMIFLAIPLLFAQDNSAFVQGVSFINNGGGYAVNDAKFDSTKRGFFPFRVELKTYDTTNNFLKELSFEERKYCIIVKNDSIIYYDNAINLDFDSSVIYELNINTNKREIAAKLPYYMSMYSKGYYDSNNNILCIIFERDLSKLYWVNLQSRKQKEFSLNYLENELADKDINGICFQDDKNILLLNYTNQKDNFGIMVISLTENEVIYQDEFQSDKIEKTISVIKDNRIYTITAIQEDSTMLKVLDLNSKEVIYKMNLAPYILPERFYLYQYTPSHTKILLTYVPKNQKLMIGEENDKYIVKLEATAYSVILININLENAK